VESPVIIVFLVVIIPESNNIVDSLRILFLLKLADAISFQRALPLSRQTRKLPRLVIVPHMGDMHRIFWRRNRRFLWRAYEIIPYT